MHKYKRDSERKEVNENHSPHRRLPKEMALGLGRIWGAGEGFSGQMSGTNKGAVIDSI